MNAFYSLVALAFVAVIWNIVVSMMIVDDLSKRGKKINYFLIRLYLPWYVDSYRRITKAEAGQPGVLYYHWEISITVMLVVALLAVLVLVGR